MRRRPARWPPQTHSQSSRGVTPSRGSGRFSPHETPVCPLQSARLGSPAVVSSTAQHAEWNGVDYDYGSPSKTTVAYGRDRRPARPPSVLHRASSRVAPASAPSKICGSAIHRRRFRLSTQMPSSSQRDFGRWSWLRFPLATTTSPPRCSMPWSPAVALSRWPATSAGPVSSSRHHLVLVGACLCNTMSRVCNGSAASGGFTRRQRRWVRSAGGGAAGS